MDSYKNQLKRAKASLERERQDVTMLANQVCSSNLGA